MNAMWKKVLAAAVILPLAGLVLSLPLSIGQEKAAKKTEKADKAKGRLPAYYADVVSEEQKEKIYAIQAKFADKIKALEDQLAALEKDQDTEIEKLLTADQKAKIEAARAEAAAKKKRKADEKKKKTETAAPPTSDKAK